MANDNGKDLTTLKSELDANVQRATQVGSGLSEEEFNWSPGPGRWSIGQCFAHLNIVDGGDTQAIRQAIDSGRSSGLTGSGPFHYGLLSRKFVASMEPPATRAFQAPGYYVPPVQVPQESTFKRFEEIQKEIRSLLTVAAGLDLARVKATLPALPSWLRPFIKMPLGARFELLVTHDRRHLWQAEQVKKQLPA